MRVMAAPRKYPDELRERATRIAVDARRDPATRSGALKRIGQRLGINPESRRNWVLQAEIDEGTRSGTTTDDATRLAELEREVRELRRANAILKSASAFFAAELDPPPPSPPPTTKNKKTGSGSSRSARSCRSPRRRTTPRRAGRRRNGISPTRRFWSASAGCTRTISRCTARRRCTPSWAGKGIGWPAAPSSG